MCPGPTFDRVYLALKEQLTGGRYAPGDHLEPAAIGEELNSSITPVRDALHRLVGERLVEAPRTDGFRVPAPTEAELRDLYGWSRDLLDLALRKKPGRAWAIARSRFGEDVPSPDARRPTIEEVFLEIARRSGSGEHETAVESANDRLGAARAAEELVFPDVNRECEELRLALIRSDVAALRVGLAAYHKRRQRRVADLLVAMRLRQMPW